MQVSGMDGCQQHSTKLRGTETADPDGQGQRSSLCQAAPRRQESSGSLVPVPPWTRAAAQAPRHGRPDASRSGADVSLIGGLQAPLSLAT